MTTATPDPPARHVLASDPLLRWDAITAHARDHHHTTWPSDDAALTEITGAFDGILPAGFAYFPDAGTITTPELPAPPPWAPAWKDPQLLNCLIATLAAAKADCDLQDIYGEHAVIAPPDRLAMTIRYRPGPGAISRELGAYDLARDLQHTYGDMLPPPLAAGLAEFRAQLSAKLCPVPVAQLEAHRNALDEKFPDTQHRYILCGNIVTWTGQPRTTPKPAADNSRPQTAEPAQA